MFAVADGSHRLARLPRKLSMPPTLKELPVHLVSRSLANWLGSVSKSPDNRFFVFSGSSMSYRNFLLFAFSGCLLAACGEPADTHPGQPVTKRRAAFEKILRAFEPMGVQLRGQRYQADSFLKRATELDALKNAPWEFFGADTNYPPTHATSAVWSEPEHFETEKRTFIAAVTDLRQAAESRDEKKVAAAYEAVHESCRNCHKTFKSQ